MRTLSISPPSWKTMLLAAGTACTVAACAVGANAVDSVDDAGGGTDDGAADAADARAVRDSSAQDAFSPGDAGGGVDSGIDASGTPDTGTAPDADVPDTSTVDASGCAAHGFSGALVTFDLAALAGNEASAPPKSSANGVTGGALTRSAALTVVSGSGSINSSGWAIGAAADPNKYYTFSVTPAAGCSVVLASLALNVSASGTGPTMGDVATSVDAYVARRGPFAGTSTSTVQLAGVSASGVIEIRVFGYGASSAGGTWRIQSTMTLTGSIN